MASDEFVARPALVASGLLMRVRVLDNANLGERH